MGQESGQSIAGSLQGCNQLSPRSGFSSGGLTGPNWGPCFQVHMLVGKTEFLICCGIEDLSSLLALSLVLYRTSTGQRIMWQLASSKEQRGERLAAVPKLWSCITHQVTFATFCGSEARHSFHTHRRIGDYTERVHKEDYIIDHLSVCQV